MNSPENINMLLEIISENPIFKAADTPGLKDECLHVLMNFYEKEKSINQDLITFNKKYLTFMLNKIKTIGAKIDEKIELYNAKDIIAERRHNYEKQFQQKKEEFENAIALKPPPMPQFADKKDIPINMDRELKQIMEKRNLDILPQVMKQIRIDADDIQVETNVIDLNKKITWADENIFLKLKKINPLQNSMQDQIVVQEPIVVQDQIVVQEPIVVQEQFNLQDQINNINIKLDLILSKL